MSDANLPRIERVASSENYARFHLEPLDAGFGMTLGNALRRVLLSSLTGAAVTSIRIDGVFHEFSYIPHMKEDTTELILNLKQLRLRCHSDRPVRLLLEVSGVGRVVAGDIICPSEVEIVNPELHLATLDSEEAHLSMELMVQKGKGFVSAGSRESLAIGVIPVDAIFTPLRRVNFQVENTRVGQVTNYDRLILDVWTDGTITPDEALAESAQIVTQHLNLLVGLGGRLPVPLKKEPAFAIPASAYDVPIDELRLSVRAYNCLKRAGISKVGQVLEMSEESLLKGVRNFGQRSLEELRACLAARGFARKEAAAPVEAAPPPVEEAELIPKLVEERLAEVGKEEEVEEELPEVALGEAVTEEMPEEEISEELALEEKLEPPLEEEEGPKQKKGRPRRRERREQEYEDYYET